MNMAAEETKHNKHSLASLVNSLQPSDSDTTDDNSKSNKKAASKKYSLVK